MIFGTLIITLLLAIPLTLLDPPKQASQDPSGLVFEIQEKIDETFASPAHIIGFIVESKNGDVLTPEVLSELLFNETTLRSSDFNKELTPSGLKQSTYLREFFHPSYNQKVTGLLTLADAVQERLINDNDLDTTLFEASEKQVKIAIHRIFQDPRSADLKESLSSKASSLKREINGQIIDWWTSPAMLFVVVADNNLLGGGTLTIGVGGDQRTLDKEQLNRNVQKLLRGEQNTYNLWGLAIDVNLEAQDQGRTSALFITLTAIAAIGIVGLTLRSYWSVALTGMGLGILIIWLKAISQLVGLKSGLSIDLIVPIAMIAFGVDFAIHSGRRYQEEKILEPNSRKAFVLSITGVLLALSLALASDAIAFLANASSEVEVIIHFGIAAGIGIFAAFFVLGIIFPLALSLIEQRPTGNSVPFSKVLNTFGAILAGVGYGSAIIITIAVSYLQGIAILSIVFVLTILIPLALRRTAIIVSRYPSSPKLNYSPGDNAKLYTDYLLKLTRYRHFILIFAIVISVFTTMAALKLEAKFDAKDFFSKNSDFTISLDKLDQHVAKSSGEPAAIFIEGDLSKQESILAIEKTVENFHVNPYVAHHSNGMTIIPEPNILQILNDILASGFARKEIFKQYGVNISVGQNTTSDLNDRQIEVILDYAVTRGVPGPDETLIYTVEDVSSVLRKNGSYTTQFRILIPGTRELSMVEKARKSIINDLEPLQNEENITKHGFTGSPFVRQAQLEATTRSLQISIPIAAGASFILLLVVFRSFRYALVTIIPIGLVVSWLYGIMWLTGFSLNLVTATIGAVSIGVGIDFAVYLTQRFREELRASSSKFEAMNKSLRGSGIAITGSAASSIIGFSIMGFAPMPLFSSYGILTALMISLALIASLMVLPSLLILVTRGD